MSTSITTRAGTRTPVLRILSALLGVLVAVAFALVGAVVPAVLLGLLPLVAAAIWTRAPRAAAVLAGLPAAAVAVWWVVYEFGHGFRLEEPLVEVPFLIAGPVALALLAVLTVAVRDRFRSRRGRS